MSTNKPSNDQPDKASDFDDELGVPAYKPTNDSTSASGSQASASPASASPASASSDSAGSKPSTGASSATTAGAAGGAVSGAAAKAGTSPSDEPTTSFERPKDADIKASTANKAGSQRAGGARIVESVDPVSAQPSAPASKAKQQGQAAAAAPAAAGAQSASTQSATEQEASKRTAAEQPAQAEAVEESQRSSVFDRPGRAQPQEITPNNTQAPQSPVESQPRETMNMGPTTGSQNNSYDDRDFASRNASFEEEPTTVTPAADYGYEPTTVQPAASPAGDATNYGVAGAGAAGAGAAGAGAAGMASTQHFDSPSQYSDETAMSLDADSAAAAQYEEEKALRRQYGKRGTIDFGLLFIRIALGGYLIIEGVRTLFSIGASAGISGLEGEYANYAMSNLLATGMPVLQLVAGVFLVLGLLTPLASMAAMVATGFMAIHELAASGTGLDIFAWPEALWLALVLFVVNVGVQFTGPGFISVDSALGVKALSSPARRPLASSWIFFILGAAALVAVWWFGAGINPLN
ncbi:DoxX family protein [Corynebacterium ammoniagenes]|uniref:DoxX family protein n=1 Tax=Corynebacterium ammoniagenes TaxID=1697 RepID=UPI001F0E0A17|nr:DoxX family protein [Corynebacterium ammoniagenes]